MTTVSALVVEPAEFVKVAFDAQQIAAVAEAMAALVPGLPETIDLRVVVDQELPTARVAVTSLDPLEFGIESGALEDTRVPRTFGTEMASASIGRLFLEVADRLDPAFGAPGVDEAIELGPRMAWDVYCYGRLARLGPRIHKPKHLYNFRTRHGFSDAVDARFEQLWSGSNLTWGDIAG